MMAHLGYVRAKDVFLFSSRKEKILSLFPQVKIYL